MAWLEGGHGPVTDDELASAEAERRELESHFAEQGEQHRKAS
ncbi:hypothetical protein [Streptomyces coeruleorubidus]